MNNAVEFHDSEIAAIRMTGGALHVVFESAYVHRSPGKPGIDPGSGYSQPVEMVFSDASYSESHGPCIGAVSDGVISSESARFENVVPLPFSALGHIAATITFTSGGVLSVTARGVSCVATGAARFIEQYDG
jgi:hypothetical protein